MSNGFIPCRLAELPKHNRLEAAREAIRHNASNDPTRHPDFGHILGIMARPRHPEEEGDLPEAEHLALLTTKYWGADGVRLTVGFLDGAPADLAARILTHMNAWAASANVTFTLVTGDPSKAQVRVTRTVRGGYWSYLGTDVLQIPPGQPTMNLESFSMSTPESEYHRVVRHETGHTLGFPHEHMRTEIVSQLDPQKTVQYFRRTQGWTAQQTQQQVLTPLDPSTLTVTGPADELSIMCYQLPGEITKDGQPIPGGTDINAADATFAASVYPKAIVPPTPPVVAVGLALVTGTDGAGRVLWTAVPKPS